MPKRQTDGIYVYLHSFITLVLHRNEWSASHIRCFTRSERTSANH